MSWFHAVAELGLVALLGVGVYYLRELTQELQARSQQEVTSTASIVSEIRLLKGHIETLMSSMRVSADATGQQVVLTVQRAMDLVRQQSSPDFGDRLTPLPPAPRESRPSRPSPLPSVPS